VQNRRKRGKKRAIIAQMRSLEGREVAVARRERMEEGWKQTKEENEEEEGEEWKQISKMEPALKG
jgi:hypothetical protein